MIEKRAERAGVITPAQRRLIKYTLNDRFRNAIIGQIRVRLLGAQHLLEYQRHFDFLRCQVIFSVMQHTVRSRTLFNISGTDSVLFPTGKA